MDSNKSTVNVSAPKHSTVYYSTKQEEAIASSLFSSQYTKRVPRSGAGRYEKGDVRGNNFLIEAHTSMDLTKDFVVNKKELEEIEKQAMEAGKIYPALAFNFGPNTPNYYVINERMFKELIHE